MAAKLNFTNLVILIVLFAVFASSLISMPEITGEATRLQVIKAVPTIGTPQLKVISLVNRPITPKVNDIVTFTATVRNFGDASPATTVDFYVNEKYIKTVPLVAIPHYSSGVAAMTWIALARGDYSVKAVAKTVPGEKVTEDNSNKITFRVV